ncbi:PEGA domain-containing protein [Candidatus Roizmanbacteria bacterium]|nr:PEGA domain-containing protein [Candidatus Roizmanbacteria bacterium]
MRRIILLFIFVIVLIGIIVYARGYRLDITKKTVTPTGIVSINSNPNAAKIYINGKLKGVTNQNFTLPPETYTIEVKKEGYTDWKRKLNLRGEIVMSVDAMLFPNNPSLSPATNLGIQRAIPIDDTDKTLLISQNGDIEKDGIYLFESTKKPLSFFPPLKLIVLKKNLPTGVNLKETTVDFSPDYSHAIFTFPVTETTTSGTSVKTTPAPAIYYISLQDGTEPLLEASASKANFLKQWDEEKKLQITKILETFPKDIKKIASDSFHIVSFSPDETKILYTPTISTLLPLIITPPMIGSNQTEDTRKLEKGNYYIYDKKEDKNFLVLTPTPTPTVTPQLDANTNSTLGDDNHFLEWYSDSKHVFIKQTKEIAVIDYDGTNKRTVYSGPFEHDFFSVNNDGKLYVLTNLNPQNNQYGDLYEVGIR